MEEVCDQRFLLLQRWEIAQESEIRLESTLCFSRAVPSRALSLPCASMRAMSSSCMFYRGICSLTRTRGRTGKCKQLCFLGMLRTGMCACMDVARRVVHATLGQNRALAGIAKRAHVH